MKNKKATVAQVKVGSNVSIEGLRLVDGTFAIALSQVATLFSIRKNNYQLELKALLGEGFQFVKTASELNPKAVNVLTLLQFETVLTKLDRKGNKAAQDLRDAITGMGLEVLFCDAFGIESTARDRQAALDARFEGIEVRRTLTDSIQDQYLAQHEGETEAPMHAFSNPSDTLNRLLTGHTAKYWRDKFGLADNAALRNHWHPKQLRRITNVEELAQIAIDKQGLDPIEAIKFAVNVFCYEVWPEDVLVGTGDRTEYMRKLMQKRRAKEKAS